MRQHEDAVPGHGEVGLERGDADFERTGKAEKGILGQKPARAAVALQVECHELAPVPERHNSGQDQARAASPHGASPHGDCVPGVMPAPECLGLTTARCQKGPPHHDEPDPAADPPRQAVRQPDAGAGARSRRTAAGCRGWRPRTACSTSGWRLSGDMDAARVISNDSKRGIRFHGWAPTARTCSTSRTRAAPRICTSIAVEVASGESRNLTPLPGRAGADAGPQPRLSRYRRASASTSATRPGTTSSASTSARGKRELLFENTRRASRIVLDRQLKPRLASSRGPRRAASIGYRIDDGKLDRDRGGRARGRPDHLHRSASRATAARSTGISSIGRDKAALFAIDWPTGKRALLAEHPKADIGRVLAHPETRVIEAAGAMLPAPRLDPARRGAWPTTSSSCTASCRARSALPTARSTTSVDRHRQRRRDAGHLSSLRARTKQAHRAVHHPARAQELPAGAHARRDHPRARRTGAAVLSHAAARQAAAARSAAADGAAGARRPVGARRLRLRCRGTSGWRIAAMPCCR